MSLTTESGEHLQTEGEHHTARCKVCRTRINIPLDPYCCTVCMNSHQGAMRRALESAYADTMLINRMRAKPSQKVKRRKL